METSSAATAPSIEQKQQQQSSAEVKASVPTDPNHEEYQYLNLIREILERGEHRPDRTGTGTYSIFAPPQLHFSLSKSTPTPSDPHAYTLILPLLTTKRVFTRAVIAELLWFISGNTSSQPLTAQGIKIWDGNGSRAYLDSIGLSHREEGDLGPVYGFQWRHFGADYTDAKADYTGKGVDQLKEVVRKLRRNPYDRRIVLSAWNVADLSKMALPPCHMFAQFSVSFDSDPPTPRRNIDELCSPPNDTSPPAAQNGAEGGKRKTKGKLNTILYQRSCDMGLGVPFNIASYALLTHMLAHAADLQPGTLTHTMGDAHVYLDHVEALGVQLKRDPRPFPELEIRKDRIWDRDARDGKGASSRSVSKESSVDEEDDDIGIDGWKLEDFVIKGYEPHKSIAMKMSV